MGYFERVPVGTQEEGKLQCVFGVIYCRDAQPYKAYEGVSEKVRKLDIPLVLMQMRWDGTIGFAGGKVDPGETLVQAVKRELDEEIAYKVDEDKLLPLATFASEKSNIHSFAIEVSYEELLNIKDNSVNSAHNIAENLGSIFAPIINSKYTEYDNFLKNNFCATAKLELETLVRSQALLVEV